MSQRKKTSDWNCQKAVSIQTLSVAKTHQHLVSGCMVVISHHPVENLASLSKLNQCTVVLLVQLHSSGNILLHQHWTHGDNFPSLLPWLYFIYMLEQMKLHANLPSLHVTRENVMLYGCKEASV